MARKSTQSAPAFAIRETVFDTVVVLNNNDDANLLNHVHSFVANNIGYHEARKYQQKGFPLEMLLRISDKMRTELANDGLDLTDASWPAFFRMLDDQKAERRQVVDVRLTRGEMLFGDIPFIFTENSEVIHGFGEEAFAGRVKAVELVQTMFSTYWAVKIAVITNLSGRVNEGEYVAKVYPFDDLTPLKGFVLRMISDEDRATLTARGILYRKFSDGSAHGAYRGMLLQQSWWSNREYRADGRVMVDMKAFQIIDPDNYRNITRSYDDDETGTSEDVFTIQDADLWRCYPFLYGFSFTAKQWGRLRVAGLSDIQWRDDAFDKLVLPAEEKQLVKALVQHQNGSFQDIISGKGGGTIFLLHGEPGQGKAQPLDAIVQTPDGPRTMGDLQKGDFVYAADGSTAEILATYPQGVRPVFELTFADGRKVRADINHLWNVKRKLAGGKNRKPHVGEWDTVTTQQIFARHRADGQGKAQYVPLAAACGDTDVDLPIDPWLMGILIGDGFFKDKHLSFSTNDQEIVDRVRQCIPDGYEVKHIDQADYRIKMIERDGNERHVMKLALEQLGLYGLGSHERFIPDLYLAKASAGQRLELMRGLIDSDGYIGKDKTVQYTTTSPQLRDDVRKLVWSLGGIATVCNKTTAYYGQGEKIAGRPAYQIGIRHRDPKSLVWLERKKDRLEGSHQYAEKLALRITDIQYVGDEETKCILIDHPDHLYLTEDWVVTHNTLTAETVAEILHRPLYMISVGELGTNPDDLEKRLRTILDIATMWDAVLLLDEADIFLEARDEQNIIRNAMVGVFLRLLEYHQGVLFLTTNRVRNIDTAFFSRISVALKFDGAGEEKRRLIWTNLLSAAEIRNVDPGVLAGYDLNGRQIKNAIRLAQTLAKADEVAVTIEHIERTIRLTESFKREVMN